MTTSLGEFRISSKREDVDLDAVHDFLTHCYWAEGISRELVKKSIDGSLPFSVFHNDRQIGFARVITDQATYAYLSDVYILDEYRGQKLGTRLIETILADPRLQDLRRFALFTRDAHNLYAPLGFQPAKFPERYLEIVRPATYKLATDR